MKAKRYEATVECDGQFWLVRVAGVGSTQARHLRELETMTADLIEVMTGARKPQIDYVFRLPREVRVHLDRAERLRDQSAKAQHEAAEEQRAAARALHNAGVPLRDIGRVFGVSYQRAHQLVSSSS
jgi:hypothetical protein